MAAPILVKRQCLLLFVKEIKVVTKHKNLFLGLVRQQVGDSDLLNLKVIGKKTSTVMKNCGMYDGISASCENASSASLKSCRWDNIITWNISISWKGEMF